MNKKTLLFCTGWSDTQNRWNDLFRVWFDHVKKSNLHYDQIIIPDDGSTCMPDPMWIEAEVIDSFSNRQPTSEVVFYKFPDNLGNHHEQWQWLGCYRSIQLAAEYSQRYNFEKIIYLESDARLLSNRVCDYINTTNDTWTAMYCPKFNMPELGIMFCSGTQLETYYNTMSKTYNEHSPIGFARLLEKVFPFTHVEKNFVGDRYSEYPMPIPDIADYACQTK
jgi:hypothetical protein